MAIQTTPHTRTQQNVNAAQDDLESNRLMQNQGRTEDAKPHANSDGPQSGGTRAFSATQGRSNLPKVQQEDAALTGHTGTRTPHGQKQGITNHSMNEESARQEKVVSQRPDARPESILLVTRFARRGGWTQKKALLKAALFPCSAEGVTAYDAPYQRGW